MRGSLTRLGLPAAKIGPGQVDHWLSRADVALWAEDRWGLGSVISERELRFEELAAGKPIGSAVVGELPGGRPMLHRPDLLVTDNGSPIAIEVELTPKAPRRLEHIVRAWRRARHLDHVLYVVPAGPVQRAVERAVTATNAQQRVLCPRAGDAGMTAARGQLQLVNVAAEHARDPRIAAASSRGVDDASFVCLHEALRQARNQNDQRSPFAIIASCLLGLGIELPERSVGLDLAEARDEWLRRLRGSGRSASTVTAYRTALDDLIGWLGREGIREDRLREETIVSYLDDYRRRARPAAATYYRRFTLLRRFFRWLSSRAGTPDPFLDLDAPPKPTPVADWLAPQSSSACSWRRRRLSVRYLGSQSATASFYLRWSSPGCAAAS